MSFVIFDIPTLEDNSFAILKQSDLECGGGAELLAIGYNGKEAYRDLMSQLKYHVFLIESKNEYKYQYIWAKDVVFTENEAITSEGAISVINRE